MTGAQKIDSMLRTYWRARRDRLRQAIQAAPPEKRRAIATIYREILQAPYATTLGPVSANVRLAVLARYYSLQEGEEIGQ